MTAATARVLIAEQNDAARQFLTDNLEADGYRPVGASDTAAALELLAGAFEALIVDVNGETLGLVDAIRSETRPELDPQLPILVLSSPGGRAAPHAAAGARRRRRPLQAVLLP